MTQGGGPGNGLVVEHHRAEREFRITCGAERAVLSYELSPGVIEFTHTGVPESFRRRGIAAQLTQAGLDYARAEGRKVVPTCWYVAAWIQQHPEYQALLRDA